MRAKKPKGRNPFSDSYKRYDTSQGYGNEQEWRNFFYERMTGDQARIILDNDPDDPYTILGVSKGVTFAVIKSRFRTLVMQFHPDRNSDSQEAALRKTQRVIAAFELIKEQYGEV